MYRFVSLVLLDDSRLFFSRILKINYFFNFSYGCPGFNR